MMKRTFAAVVMILACLVASAGCVKDACVKAVPVLSQGQGIVGDATLAVDQAQRYLDGLDVPADVKAKIQLALDSSRAGLRAGAILLAGASKACESPDLAGAFGAFVESWNALSVLLHQAKASKGVAAGPLPFQDPLIVKILSGHP